MHAPTIVIGAGLAAWTCVRELRKLEASAGLAAAPITVVTGDSGDFYAKPSLSNAFAQSKSPAQLVTTPAAVMAQKLSVTLLAHTQVHAIDTAERTVSTDAGPLAYRQLVMANGAQPIRVPIGGDQLLVAQAVKTVNSLHDFALFHSTLQQTAPSEEPSANTVSKHVLIMGAGLIGCEFANDLVAAGVQVTVVDPSPRPLSALLPSEASEQLQAALAERGVQWMLGTTVERIELVAGVGAPSIGLPTYRVFLKNGGIVTVHALLSAIGLRANTLLASQAGIVCERGIVVNQQLQTSADSVYAIGDAAQYAGAGTLPYVMPIMHAAKTLALTLLGKPSALVFPHMPVAIKTPALPLLVLPPAIGSVGTWQTVPNTEPDANTHHISSHSQWQWRDANGAVRGFCLAGASTKFRQRHLDAMAP